MKQLQSRRRRILDSFGWNLMILAGVFIVSWIIFIGAMALVWEIVKALLRPFAYIVP